MALVRSQAGRGSDLMPPAIREAQSEDSERIREFNARLAGAGVSFALPVQTRELMPRQGGSEIPYQMQYLLMQGSTVRGGYILKHEQMFSGGDGFDVGNYQLPLSEGIVDRRYAMVGLQLIRDALARQPRLYCLGMGSTARPLPQLLARLGWAVSTVPFFFRVEHAANFSREIRWLRQRPAVRLALDLARISGVFGGAVALARFRRRLMGPRVQRDLDFIEVTDLPQELDGIFSGVRVNYGLLCDRRMAAMQGKLPRDSKLSRWILCRRGMVVGWTVLSQSKLRSHTQFGDMSLGSIVDGLAAPDDVEVLVGAACARLEAAGCDLLVSNQCHPAWMAALRRHGFAEGPSNFVLALSPALVAAQGAAAHMHFTRADGDGPINL